MKIKIKLFPLDIKASDTSSVPRKVFEEYLKSPEHASRIASKTMIGGMTHINRNDPDGETGLGEFDEMLISGNITHYLESVYIGTDNWVYAVMVVLDDESQYSGKSLDIIKTFKRLVLNGIFIPVSIVIKAYWTDEDVATKIVFLGGCDFTLSPGYSNAAVIELIE